MDTCNEQQQVLLCQPSSFAQDTQNPGNHWNHQEPHDQAMLYTGSELVGDFPLSNQKESLSKDNSGPVKTKHTNKPPQKQTHTKKPIIIKKTKGTFTATWTPNKSGFRQLAAIYSC